MTKSEFDAFKRWQANVKRLCDKRDDFLGEMRALYLRAGGGTLHEDMDIYDENDMYLQYLMTSADENTRKTAMRVYRSYYSVCAVYNAMLDLETEFQTVGCNGRSGRHPLEV